VPKATTKRRSRTKGSRPGQRRIDSEEPKSSGPGITGGRSNEQSILSLQRTIGNRATGRLLRQAGALKGDGAAPGATSGSAVVQRGFFDWISSLFSSKKSKPAVAKPKEKSPIALAGGQKILTDAFGDVKEIVPGKVEVLATPEFKAAYDEIYGETEWSWDTYVVPTYGGLNGFAHDGTNYINSDSAGLHTVVHEMLHNNTAGDWTGVVGSRWDEGTTEVLTQEACAKVNEPAPVCYPGESPVVREAIAQGLPLADLQEAYLNGGAQAKVAKWVDDNCEENWATVKGYMEANDWASAKAGLAKKTE
jgi:hypothetical protein